MAGEHGVEVRAFRGTRRSSVYRAHVVPAEAFARVRAEARRAGLGVLAALDPDDERPLDRAAARRLMDEVRRLRTSAVLLDLDDDLAALASLASWSARAPGSAWLRVAHALV